MKYVPYASIPDHVDTFTRAYLEAAEWADVSTAEHRDDDTNCPTHGESGCECRSDREALELAIRPRWAADSIAQAVADCRAFQRDNAADLADADDARAGADFWLTRNLHGTGYWDGPYAPDVAKRLTDAAHAYGEVWVLYDREAEELSLYETV